MITDELLDRICRLAQLEITDEEREDVKSDMQHILDMVDKLKELDTDGVEPFTSISDTCRVREDEEKCSDRNEDPGKCRATLLDGAPGTDGEYLRVPDSLNPNDVKDKSTAVENDGVEADKNETSGSSTTQSEDDLSNAFITEFYSCNPLDGLKVAIKDNICVAGQRTTAGSRILENYIPTYSATAVEKLEQAGMAIVGKTNMDEFGMGSTSETSFFGAVKNPYDESRVAGGSSGGSAAAVATGLADAALGTDTGGSIRQPCAWCGLTGIKPTYGTVSRYGLISYASSFDQIGPIAKDISTCAKVLEIISGPDEKDSTTIDRSDSDSFSAIEKADGSNKINQKNNPGNQLEGLKIGVLSTVTADKSEPHILKAVDNVSDTLELLGAKKVQVNLRLLDYAVAAYYIIACAEASSNLERYDGVKYGRRAENYANLNEMYKKTRTEGFGREVRNRIILGTFVLSSGFYDAYYLKALKARRLIFDEFERVFSDCDALLMPVTTGKPPKLGESLKDPVQMYLNDVYTVIANLCGFPAVAFPVKNDRPYSADNLPVGVQLMGPLYSEQKLINIVLAYEKSDDKAGD
ncbi:MAG: Asp-tRNA(Asn)/Glu-tRNA(Gln) amidotransferase subunit GatA [Eubacterium sp.]|nr:Asp-tRNA(Asn)/Glu-tRNA(Gln) amidotransferase subunit GatA [Eubacterium sp.]